MRRRPRGGGAGPGPEEGGQRSSDWARRRSRATCAGKTDWTRRSPARSGSFTLPVWSRRATRPSTRRSTARERVGWQRPRLVPESPASCWSRRWPPPVLPRPAAAGPSRTRHVPSPPTDEASWPENGPCERAIWPGPSSARRWSTARATWKCSSCSRWSGAAWRRSSARGRRNSRRSTPPTSSRRWSPPPRRPTRRAGPTAPVTRRSSPAWNWFEPWGRRWGARCGCCGSLPPSRAVCWA